jgi:hypothetical protein
MFGLQGGPAMMMTKEQEFLKAQKHLDGLVALVGQAIEQGRRIDEIERELFRELLRLGLSLLSAFVAGHGDGDVGAKLEKQPEAAWNRLPEPHTRRYLSVFGALTITRFVYGTREGQKIEAAPLDQRLGLPASDFSYVLEDWVQRLCTKESFAEAGQSLETLLGLRLGVRTLETMNQRVAAFADSFRDQQALPPAEEEGALLVVTADGKGVPMRRPLEERVRGHHRRTKGEKANKKQMSYVGAVYSIAPFVRTAEDIVDEVFRVAKAKDRPRPQHKRVRAEMTQVAAGAEVRNGRETLFAELSDEVVRRRRALDLPLVCLLDGERALWDKRQEFLPWSVGILDIFHVLERLWLAAHAWHAETSPQAEAFVSERLRLLLQGQVGTVLGGLRRRLKTHPVSAEKRRTVQGVLRYLENNRAHMHYDQYLAKGYPIGSGVAEGACRHLVKDRMEQSGMRWTVPGAQAMLDTRAIYLNGDWQVFHNYRVEKEQAELHWQLAA